MTGSVAVDTALLALKIGFLVLLYLFIWMIVRSATRDVRTAPQESIVIGAAQAAELRAQQLKELPPARLTVVESPALATGRLLVLREPLTVGRAPECGLKLERDEFVSSRHARLTPSEAGLFVEDLSSTNGTFVNDAQVTTSRLLQAGDVITIGETKLRVEA
ncbi:MAG TPA: FHA domain-containing protein [Gaiellaceae bacterium]|nr:FHA domain-containing protein [Gaiellaceae bacterium]